MIKNKKILLLAFLAAMTTVLGLVKIASASTTAAVSATVTVQNIGVALDGTDGSVAYGTLAVGTSNSTVNLGDTEKVKNSGNITEKLSISGANTTGCVWTLGSAVGVGDTYVHKFSTNGGSSYTALTTNYQTLVATIGVGVSQPVDLTIIVPTSSSCYTQSTSGVTVLAELP